MKQNPLTLNTTRKALVLYKVSEEINCPLAKEIKALFDNPSTYLQLPSESERQFVVGKRLTGPQYNDDDQIIPYSIVGNPKIFKKRTNNNNKNFSRMTSIQSGNKSIKDLNKSESPGISEDEINRIFARCRENIDNNNSNKNTKNKNDFLSNIPNITYYNEKRKLLLQEKYLINFKLNKIKEKQLIDKIRNKLYNLPNKRLKEKELLMDRTDAFRIQKERTELIQKNEDFNKRFGNKSWFMSLRRPKNFVGERNQYVNFGTNNKPYWGMMKDKLPNLQETVINPSLNEVEKEKIKSKRMSSYMKTEPSIVKYMNKTQGIMELKVKGKKLLQLEQENAKGIKGKKKIIYFNYDKDYVKDINIAEKWKDKN